MATFEELVKAKTEDQFKAQVYAIAEELGLDTSAWYTKSVFRVTFAIVAAVLYLWQTLALAAVRGGLLDYAEGEWLTLLASNVYGVIRPEATYATPPITFTNAGGNLYKVAANESVIVKNVVSGVTYRVFGPFTIAPGPSSVTVVGVADVAGSAGDADAGEITSMITVIPNVTVNNAAAGRGSERMGDEDLRRVCRLARAAVTPGGPPAAYEVFAMFTRSLDTLTLVPLKRANGTPVSITRSKVTENPYTQDVRVVFAGKVGAVDADSTIAANKNINRFARPLGVHYAGVSAVNHVLNITYLARAMRSAAGGLTEAALVARINAALAARIEQYPIGGIEENPGDLGKVIAGDLRAVVDEIQVEGGSKPVFRVASFSLSTDIEILPDRVVVPGVITGTVTYY